MLVINILEMENVDPEQPTSVVASVALKAPLDSKTFRSHQSKTSVQATSLAKIFQIQGNVAVAIDSATLPLSSQECLIKPSKRRFCL